MTSYKIIKERKKDIFYKYIINASKNKEKIVVKKRVKSMWRIFGIGDEFTTEDKVIYLVSYVWNIFFTLVFIFSRLFQ